VLLWELLYSLNRLGQNFRPASLRLIVWCSSFLDVRYPLLRFRTASLDPSLEAIELNPRIAPVFLEYPFNIPQSRLWPTEWHLAFRFSRWSCDTSVSYWLCLCRPVSCSSQLRHVWIQLAMPVEACATLSLSLITAILWGVSFSLWSTFRHLPPSYERSPQFSGPEHTQSAFGPCLAAASGRTVVSGLQCSKWLLRRLVRLARNQVVHVRTLLYTDQAC
jgi:hypothetical protein